MKNIKKFGQLFEADIKNNKGIPLEYLQKIEQDALEFYGNVGLNRNEQRELGSLFHDIMRLQYGHEVELCDISKQIILETYGSILTDVDLDLKIVNPNDQEKKEMVDKMQSKPKENDEQNADQSDNFEIQIQADENEVDKRKILNIIMQGESQNIHTMLYNKKEEFDLIANGLVEKCLRFLELNEKIIWDSNKPKLEDAIKMMPQMANVVEVDWKDEENSENTKPTIKVRALEITMILHETVKGIYELIMANAIPSDPIMAKKILELTDTLQDEEDDIKYGKKIAADLRDYIYMFLEKYYPNAMNIENIREHIYGKLSEMRASLFVDFMKYVLSEDFNSADRILKNSKIVDEIINEFKEYDDAFKYNDMDNFINKPEIETKPTETTINYAKLSKNELQFHLDKALDSGDFEKVREIQKYL